MTGQDDWIETQLRTRRIEPIPDAGFSEQVLTRLHARRSAHRWIVPTLSGIGALATALTVPKAQLSSAVALVAEPQAFFVLALGVAALVWIGSAWVLLDRRHRAL
jgi:hypothetical protein